MNSWQRVEVENEVHFRDLNEWTRTSLEDATVQHSWEVYVCECGDATCTEPITLTRIEYELVRAQATHFALAPNHENPELDQVVEEHERYTVVAKWLGEAARIAYDTDPRQ